jgi:hypothetical protein
VEESDEVDVKGYIDEVDVKVEETDEINVKM